MILFRDVETLILKIDGKITKFVIGTDHGFPEFEEADLDDFDRLQLDWITFAEYGRRVDEAERIQLLKEAEERLAKAWEFYNEYGEKGGFAKPLRLPAGVQEILNSVELVVDGRKHDITSDALTFKGCHVN